MASLPFLTEGALFEQGGSSVDGADAIPCSVWPAQSAHNSPVGRHHTHKGEAHLDFADDLQVPNRRLEVDGDTYSIVAATPMSFVPHVVLELILTSGRS